MSPKLITQMQLLLLAGASLVLVGFMLRPLSRVWITAYRMWQDYLGRTWAMTFIGLTGMAIVLGVVLGLGIFGVALGPGFWWWIR
jgi:hypothetical protein